MSRSKLSHAEKIASAISRLEAYTLKIPFTDCWIWTGAVTDCGYGQLNVAGKTTKAHRFAYSLRFGMPERLAGAHGTVIRHKCDMPCCVNPNHMEVGTQQDNLADTKNRDRLKFGSKHHASKLTESDVQDILAAKGKESQSVLAKRYGICASVISRIYGGRAWARAARGD